MGRMVIAEPLYERVWTHLKSAPVEGFAFLLCRWCWAGENPVFIVEEAELVDPGHVIDDRDGWALSDEALDRVINRATVTNLALVEVHNHGFGPPAFSVTDRRGLEPFAKYVVESLPGRPYAAMVWADEEVVGEWFGFEDRVMATGHLSSVSVVGHHLRQAAHHPSAQKLTADHLGRQLPLLGAEGQRTLGRLKIAVIGLSGTGSHIVQGLAYLGAKDLLLIDDDVMEDINLNRVVTATPPDVDSLKTITARRTARSINPDIKVEIINEALAAEGRAAEALAGVDFIFGCVDDDGPRLLLNRIAIESAIPYFDIATGIILDDPHAPLVGGRLAVVVSGGPCLVCTDELDLEEVKAYFLEPDEREEGRKLGYITGAADDSPAVVSLNGVLAHLALTELTLWLAGTRPPVARADFDAIGEPERPGPRLMPRAGVARNEGCPECGHRLEEVS